MPIIFHQIRMPEEEKFPIPWYLRIFYYYIGKFVNGQHAAVKSWRSRFKRCLHVLFQFLGDFNQYFLLKGTLSSFFCRDTFL